MPVNPKKLKAFVDKEKKQKPLSKSKTPPPKDDEREEEADDEQEDDAEDESEDDEGDEDDDDKDDVEFSEKDLLDIETAVKKGRGDKQLVQLGKEVDLEDDEVPEWAEAKLWNKAKDVVEPYEDKLDEPAVIIAHVYKLMGGEIDA